MGKINPNLLARLRMKLGISRATAYQMIDKKVREVNLPRDLAAIKVASENGVSISRFASEEQLASLRAATNQTAPSALLVPVTMAPKRRAPTPSKGQLPRRSSNSVFVVHGRDRAAREALFTFLRALGLQPLEWTQVIRRTQQGSPNIDAILDHAFASAAAVVVLLTPDDEARLRREFLNANDASYEKELTGQARPNVLFEAGMAFGRNPRSTILVQLGELRPFSDVAGRHISRLGNDPESRTEVATKLANAGCKVDRTGTDWLAGGQFPEPTARKLSPGLEGGTESRRQPLRRSVSSRRDD